MPKYDIFIIGVDTMINRFKNQIYLHAASEVFDEFINSKKSFLECCAEFNRIIIPIVRAEVANK